MQDIIALEIDEKTVAKRSLDIEQEKKIAIYDLLEKNYFKLVKPDITGPFDLILSIKENRVLFNVRQIDKVHITIIGLSLNPFRGLIRDYLSICDSYFQAIRTSSPSQIETIDMARRGLHNEGSRLLEERLYGKVKLDDRTSRRLFTLVSVLHLR
ncbi:MAG: hypothetical protein CFH01_00832 [Alphaproteobacteria bacterium MarineAlpha2_Bin1]|nr:MAG: hypothetical protein CFH01_00832 [Alphaproteobacteria bacterium MarineAlpha2_Bin1]